MELLPLAQETRPNCSSCVAACCLKDTVIPLKSDEADRLLAQGTEMHQVPREEWDGHKPGWGRAFYKFDADCANLTPDPETGQRMCADYENRPKACRQFSEGSFGCELMRAVRMPVESGLSSVSD